MLGGGILPNTHTHKHTDFHWKRNTLITKNLERKSMNCIQYTLQKEEYELICLIFYFPPIFNIIHMYYHTYLSSML